MALEKLNPSKLPDTSAIMSLFEANYKVALPDELEVAKKDAEKKHAEAGLAMPLFDTGSISLGSFCTQWPKIKTFLNMAIRFASWFSPGPAAMAKAFLATFESTVLPIVCPIPPAE